MSRLGSLPPVVVAFAVALLVYVAALLAIGPDGSGDQPHYLLEARSLAHDGSRDLADEYDSPEDLAWALGYEGRLEPHAYRYGDGEHLVSVHGVGLPLLLAPVAALTDSVQAMRLLLCLLSALAAALLFDVLRRLGVLSGRWLWAAWAATALSLPWVMFAGFVYPELPGALCVLVVVRALLTRPMGPRWALAAGLACAALPWLHVRYLAVAVALLLAVVVRAGAGRERTLAVAPFVAALALLAYLWNGWYASLDPRAPYAVPRFAATVASQPSLLYPNGLGSLLSPDYGWLPWAPVAILAVASLGWVCWRFGRWAIYATAVAVGYLVMIGLSSIYPSYNPPGRFVLLLVPLAALPLACALVRWRAVRVLFVPLAAVTALWTVVGVAKSQQAFITGTGHPQLALAARVDAIWPHFRWDDRRIDRTRTAAQLEQGAGGSVWEGLRLPEGTYLVAFAVGRTAGPSEDGEVARLAVDVDGRRAAEEPIVGRELGGDGNDVIVSVPFAVPAGGGTVDLRFAASGPAALGAAGMQVVSVPNTLYGEVGARTPQPGLTVAWLVLLAGASAAMVVADRRRRS